MENHSEVQPPSQNDDMGQISEHMAMNHSASSASPSMTDQVGHNHRTMNPADPHAGHTMADQTGHDHKTKEHADPHAGHAMADQTGHDHNTMDHSDPHAGHSMTDHAGHEQLFRRKFRVSLLLSIPVLWFSDGFKALLGITLPGFSGDRWIGAFFAVIVFIYGGLPFLQMAIPELKNRKPGMMTLISWPSQSLLFTPWRCSSCPAAWISSGNL